MVGIYALWFEKSSMVYIGQSQNIESRYTEHLYKLKNNRHTNYRVKDEYVKYGAPELVILEKCSIGYLNDLEVIWTAEFNSIKEGLNIIEAGEVGYGANSNSSKYSKIQLLRVFSLLYKTDLMQTEIAKKTGVNRSSVSDIKNGNSHLWLKDVYPAKYIKMKTIRANG